MAMSFERFILEMDEEFAVWTDDSEAKRVYAVECQIEQLRLSLRHIEDPEARAQVCAQIAALEASIADFGY